MLNSLPLFVGLRYVRARSHKFFVSFITWVSLLCVCLGVIALIVILSVMNGLEGELRDRLLSLSAHARIFVPPAGDRNAGLERVWPRPCARRRVSPAPRRSSSSRRWRCASRTCCRCACAASTRPTKGEVARDRRSPSSKENSADLTRRLRSRHRRRRHRADVGARRRRSDDRAGADHRRERRRPNRACASSLVAGIFDADVQDYDSELLIAVHRRRARAAAESGRAHVAAREFRRMRSWRRMPPRCSRRSLPPGRRDPRLDRRSRELFPRDPHREDDGRDHPHADRRGGRVLSGRHARDGGHRQTHRHRDPAHARHLAAPRHGDLPDPGQRHRVVRRRARRRARLLARVLRGRPSARLPRAAVRLRDLQLRGLHGHAYSVRANGRADPVDRRHRHAASRWPPLSTRRSAPRGCRPPTRCGTSERQ